MTNEIKGETTLSTSHDIYINVLCRICGNLLAYAIDQTMDNIEIHVESCNECESEGGE